MTIFETNIFDAVYEIEKSPCYLCARMRRGYLYSKAKELGCNKIALGHHYDDVIETILMGMLYGAQIQTMMPKLHSTNFEGMELIRPMYLIREEDSEAEDPEVNDYESYDNGVKIVGAYLCEAQVIDGDNFEILIDNGFYTETEVRPEATPTPVPTASPTPTEEPENTATPTPEATVTPDPSEEPEAAATPDPSEEPEATATPKPRVSLKTAPSEDDK